MKILGTLITKRLQLRHIMTQEQSCHGHRRQTDQSNVRIAHRKRNLQGILQRRESRRHGNPQMANVEVMHDRAPALRPRLGTAFQEHQREITESCGKVQIAEATE